MSVAAATMLLGGLAGCGDNEATDMGTNNYPGTESLYMNGGTGTAGETGGTAGYGDGSLGGSVADRGTSHYGTAGQGTGMTGNAGNTNGHDRMTGQNDRLTGQDTANNGSRNMNQAGTTQDRVNYHKDYDGETAQRTVKQVEEIDGVEEARVIVNDDNMVVGLTADGDIDNVRTEVERSLNESADNKEVYVVTDNDAVDRIRTMDDDLRLGTAFDEIGATFSDMLNDLGQAAQRPFERSR